MSEPPVLVEADARGVARVTLNRAHVNNAYDGALLDALKDGVGKLAADPAIRAIVITGAGKHFQAGADLSWLRAMAEAGPEEAFAASMGTTGAMAALNECPKPTVALVNGACFGGGCGLVACCDVAIAATDALFGLTEVRVGVAPSPISTHLVHALGMRHARRYAITGERFDAAEALRIGLVQQVVPHGEQVDAAIAIAERIAAQAPLAVQATLANARLALHDPQAAADRLRRLVAMLAGTQDAQSAMTAFLSGRPIDFEGR